MEEFGFTEEQEMYRQTIRQLVKKELAPLARDKDILGEYAKASELLNIGALNYPEKYGGWELDHVYMGILSEELFVGGASMEIGILPFMAAFTANDVKKLPEEVQDEIAPGLISMAASLRHGYTEANSGNEQAAIKTKAVRQGDYYVINGEKQPATGCAGATYSVITAVTDPSAGTKGISQFLVPRNTPGISGSLLPFPGESGNVDLSKGGVGTPETDPMALSGCVISFDDVKIPAKYLIGREGEGQEFLQYQHNFTAVHALAMGAVGQAKRTLNEVIEHAGQRVHFGQPIIQFQGVGFQLAEYYTRIEAARLLAYRTLWLMDQGRASTTDFAMAKWYCLDVGLRAILDLMVIGGYPFWSFEHPAPRRLFGLFGFCIADGPAQMQKLRILSEIAPDAIPLSMVGRLTV